LKFGVSSAFWKKVLPRVRFVEVVTIISLLLLPALLEPVFSSSRLSSVDRLLLMLEGDFSDDKRREELLLREVSASGFG